MKKNILLLFLVFCVLFSNAQDGELDLTFNPMDVGFENGDGTNGPILSSIKQADGKIIIGGNFSKFNGISKSGLARLNTDGSLDSSFDSGSVFTYYSNIKSINIQNDGKILVSGYTGIYGGFVRLNIDGTLDTTFNSLFDSNQVYCAEVQADGKIIVGGQFTSYNGIQRNNILRLNNDGSLDTSFNPGLGALYGLAELNYPYTSNTKITNINIRPDGKIIIIGNFTAYNGVSRAHIAKLNADGSLDLSFDPGVGFGFGTNNNNIGVVNSISIQNDGKLIIGGGFNSYNGTMANGLIRLNIDGSIDNNFNVGPGFSYVLTSIISGNTYLIQGINNCTLIRDDGKIVVGGEFSNYNWINRKNVALLNSDGSLDTSFVSSTGPSYSYSNPIDYDGKVFSLISQPNNNFILSGDFKKFDNSSIGNIARVNSNSTIDLTFNISTGFNGVGKCSLIQPDGKIIVAGGNFSIYNGYKSNGIVRLYQNGSVDTSFNVGSGIYDSYFGQGNSIISMAIQADGKIVLGGKFNEFNEIIVNKFARLNPDGSIDNTFINSISSILSSNSYSINKIAIQPDNKILVCGRFYIFSSNLDYLIRLNSDGSQDISFNLTNTTSNNNTFFELQSDGKIIYYVGNSIKRINSDGSIDTSFTSSTINSNDNEPIKTLSIQPDGKILIGGKFVSINGISIPNNIARLNSNGSLDLGFNTNLSTFDVESVFTSKIQIDNKILIGTKSSTGNSLIRLNQNGSLDFTFNSSGIGPQSIYSDTQIYNLNILSDNSILILGDFVSYNNVGRNRIAKLLNYPSLGIIKNSQLESLKIYPNPAIDFINLNKEFKSISVFSLDGKLMYSKSNVKEVNISSLSKGTYIINAIDENDFTFSEKLIKL